MNLRKTTSLTALTSFVLLILTSVILYIVPPGRVAYWADWRLWGMTKEQWGEVHVTIGVLFLISIGLHLYYNWKPVTSYLKNKAREWRMTADAGVALALCALTVAGTLAMVPPFSWVVDLGAHFKDEATAVYGEPPYGHAELSSIKTFASRMGFDADKAVARLREAGLAVEGVGQSILDAAKANGLSPKGLHSLMLPEKEQGAGPVPFPDSPPGGFGNRTLADICGEYGLHPPSVIAALKAAGIEAKAGQTVKEIAGANNTGPMDVFEALKTAAR